MVTFRSVYFDQILTQRAFPVRSHPWWGTGYQKSQWFIFAYSRHPLEIKEIIKLYRKKYRKNIGLTSTKNRKTMGWTKTRDVLLFFVWSVPICLLVFPCFPNFRQVFFGGQGRQPWHPWYRISSCITHSTGTCMPKLSPKWSSLTLFCGSGMGRLIWWAQICSRTDNVYFLRKGSFCINIIYIYISTAVFNMFEQPYHRRHPKINVGRFKPFQPCGSASQYWPIHRSYQLSSNRPAL